MIIKRSKFFKIIFFVIFLFSTLVYPTCNSNYSTVALLGTKKNINKKELENRIRHIFNERCKAFVSHDLSVLPQYFDTSQKYGKWSLEHEVKRIKYLRDWSYQRGIKFTSVTPIVKVKKASPSAHGIRMSVQEVYKFNYIYTNDKNPVTNTFGVSLDHSLVLTKKNGNLVIYNDWYLDCFEDGLKAYSGEIKDLSKEPPKKPIFNLGNCPKEKKLTEEGRYNRKKAIEYADKYCGVPIGSGNNLSHNKKYRNYTGSGGDCTNFASQVIGDKDAGGLKHDYTWNCSNRKYGYNEGTQAWVNADAFKNYLLYSGKGKLIKRGTFKNLNTKSEKSPCGYVEQLNYGDLICYAIKGDIDHFAVVTNFDSHGYPMINCHTVSRYHVPWDLGWGDNDISFYLIHVR
nr:amidase domain-containing protein [Clostridium novyi]